MRPTIVTLVSVLSLGVWLIAYDCFLYVRHGVQGTISPQVYQAAVREPVMPLLVGLVLGLVLGHLFWPQR
jgi:hypothetical protein